MMNRILLIIEVFICGYLIGLMIVGSNYGLNSKWINRRNQEGFYPLFNDQWPQRFYIMDQEGEVLGKDFHTFLVPKRDSITASRTVSLDTIHVKCIISYSFSDSLYVKCLTGSGDTIVIRPETQHGKGIGCFFEQVHDYPVNSEVVMISGNEHLFNDILYQKRILTLLVTIVLFIHVLYLFLWMRRK